MPARRDGADLFTTDERLKLLSFTGSPGVQVPLEETIKGFKGLVDGEYDHLPEQAFAYVGSIDEAEEKARNLQ